LLVKPTELSHLLANWSAEHHNIFKLKT